MAASAAEVNRYSSLGTTISQEWPAAQLTLVWYNDVFINGSWPRRPYAFIRGENANRKIVMKAVF